MSGKFAGNPNYVQYERLLEQLHHLIAEGRGDSEEAETVREGMDGPWWELSEEERARLNGLSADLYMLQEEEIFEPIDPNERTQQRLGVKLKAAWERGDWEAMLQLLRKGPTFLSTDRVAYLRANAYEALGHADTARLFMEYATKLNPPDTTYPTKLFEEIA